MPRVTHLSPDDRALHAQMRRYACERGGVCTATIARTFGAVPGQLRRLIAAGYWTRLRRGVYGDRSYVTDCPDPAHLQRAAAVLAALEGVTVLSHITALRLLGLPVPPEADDRVHITRLPPRSGWEPDGVDLHISHIDSRWVQKCWGVPILGGARLALDCHQTLTPPDALAVADAVLRVRSATLDDLRDVGAARAGIPRTDGFERIIERADPGAQNWFESVSRWWLLEAGLPRPRLQAPIRDAPTGRYVYLDMLFEEHGTVGEADGRGKYAVAADLIAEKVREDWLRTEHGFEVVRWMPAEMRTAAGRAAVVARLLAAFARYHARRRERVRSHS